MCDICKYHVNYLQSRRMLKGRQHVCVICIFRVPEYTYDAQYCSQRKQKIDKKNVMTGTVIKSLSVYMYIVLRKPKSNMS